jgi:hypothetical protein
MVDFQSMPCAIGLFVLAMRNQSEKRFHLPGRAHDLVKVKVTNQGSIRLQ